MTFLQKISKKLPGWLLPVALVLVVLALIAIWRFTPLKAYTDPDFLSERITHLRDLWWTPLALIPVYILAHAIMFPNLVLNTAVILTFGGFFGWACAIVSSLMSATVFFFIGYRFGAKRLQRFHSQRLEKVQRFLQKGGIGAVVTVRLVPTAPYPIVNTAAGAIHLRYRDFIIGTFIAHLPGTVTLAVFGEQLGNVIRKPTPENIAVLAGILVAGLVIIKLVSRHARRRFEEEQDDG